MPRRKTAAPKPKPKTQRDVLGAMIDDSWTRLTVFEVSQRWDVSAMFACMNYSINTEHTAVRVFLVDRDVLLVKLMRSATYYTVPSWVFVEAALTHGCNLRSFGCTQYMKAV